ncbi:MAG: LysM peptidoglycan-binding domain-containing protein [Candidatus Aenigmatarchaeota archaeon]
MLKLSSNNGGNGNIFKRLACGFSDIYKGVFGNSSKPSRKELNEILEEIGMEPLSPEPMPLYKSILGAFGFGKNNGNGKRDSEQIIELDEELVDVSPESRLRRKYSDRFVLKEEVKKIMRSDVDGEKLAAELMKTRGIGYKTASRLLKEAGKELDEKTLKRIYRSLDKRKERYETIDEFSQKYLASKNLFGLSNTGDCTAVDIPERGISKKLKDYIISQSSENIAKSLMSVRDIEFKDVESQLREFYNEVGKKVDFDSSDIGRWYREVRKGGHIKYNTLDEWAKDQVEFAEANKELGLVKKHKKPAKWLMAGAVSSLAAAAIGAYMLLGNTIKEKDYVAPKQVHIEYVEKEKPYTSPIEDKIEFSSEKTYTVRKGDCLWKIAKNELGLSENEIAAKVSAIYEKNIGKYKKFDSSRGNHIEPGWVLKI